MMHDSDIETHPWPPYIPPHARVLLMGTFPPQPHRWSMDFYYPNRTNDFWKIIGLIFLGDPFALYDKETKTYRLDEIRSLLDKEGVALNDTGHRIRRLKGNASDKFLEIIEPVDLQGLLTRMPDVTDIATTGQKAAEVVAQITQTPVPRLGEYVEKNGLRIWRMPSTSRAYPLPLEQKAASYLRLFQAANLPGLSKAHSEGVK